jgi:hypothetical protein
MPYVDPEKKLAAMRAWRKRVMQQGYGKWLYQRRKLRFDDAENFRQALEEIVRGGTLYDIPAEVRLIEVVGIAHQALAASRRAEEELGPWKGEDHDEDDG